MARANRTATLALAHRKLKSRTIDLPLVRALLERKTRQETHLFWGEGCRNFHSALLSNRKIEAIVCCPKLLHSSETWEALRQHRRNGTPYVQLAPEEFLTIST